MSIVIAPKNKKLYGKRVNVIIMGNRNKIIIQIE